MERTIIQPINDIEQDVSCSTCARLFWANWLLLQHLNFCCRRSKGQKIYLCNSNNRITEITETNGDTLSFLTNLIRCKKWFYWNAAADSHFKIELNIANREKVHLKNFFVLPSGATEKKMKVTSSKLWQMILQYRKEDTSSRVKEKIMSYTVWTN